MRTQPSPFLVTPWQQDFLHGLLHSALADTQGDVGRASFIFPHSRPVRYLTRLLRTDPRVRRPLILPAMHTLSDLITTTASRIRTQAYWSAGLLDRVGLLLECVRAEGITDASHRTVLNDARLFFPWGVRLAALFDELLRHHTKAADFPYMEGEVSPFAALLLARLERLFTRYLAELEKRFWTTPGYDAFLCADCVVQQGSLPPNALRLPSAQTGSKQETLSNPMYIAGFHTLTGAENIIFRHLWEQHGATVMLHADPNLVHRPHSAHWSCEALLAWAREWDAPLELVEGGTPNRDTPVTRLLASQPSSYTQDQASENARLPIRYYQGFDLHSQLQAIIAELDASAPPQEQASPYTEHAPNAPDALPDDEDSGFPDQAADTVIVLPDSGLLLPVLHHLPRQDINISMGYPLTRSPLFRLLDTLIRLQQTRRGSLYYWRDLVELIRHPYLTMLQPAYDESDTTAHDAAHTHATEAAPPSLRRELYRLEQAIRIQERAYVNPGELLASTYMLLNTEEMPPRPVLALLDVLFEHALDAFARLATPHDAGLALARFCAMLQEYGGSVWERFPIDAECLYRLRRSLIPELTGSQLAHEPLDPETLFAIIRNLMDAERVPFDADPLVGLQVMGVLETRLLSFRRVIVVDAGEHSLPGIAQGDPLLPDSLRPALSLPPPHSREQVAAYHFFRLLAGAEDITLTFAEGDDSPGVHEQKKKKSRFVEELIWWEEKRRGRVLNPVAEDTQTRNTHKSDGPLTMLGSRVVPLAVQRRIVRVTPALRALIHSLRSRSISASFLDSYLRCPVRFAYERLLKLAPAQDITEGDDPLALGNLFHQALRNAYEPWLGRLLPGGEDLRDSMEQELLACFFEDPAYADRAAALPADSLAMLKVAAHKRLRDYLLAQPPTTVLALESSLSAPFAPPPLLGQQPLRVRLFGLADRIDLRASDSNDAGNGPESDLCIIDYKTGKVRPVPTSFWENDELFARMRSWYPPESPAEEADPLLAELSRLLPSVQLPLYLLLHALDTRTAAATSARPIPAATQAFWVDLGGTGEEVPLFPTTFSREERCRIILNHVPELVHFLLRHIFETPAFYPLPGAHCDWCFAAKLCTKSMASHFR